MAVFIFPSGLWCVSFVTAFPDNSFKIWTDHVFFANDVTLEHFSRSDRVNIAHAARLVKLVQDLSSVIVFVTYI